MCGFTLGGGFMRITKTITCTFKNFRIRFTIELHYIISTELIRVLQSIVLHLSVNINKFHLHYITDLELPLHR